MPKFCALICGILPEFSTKQNFFEGALTPPARTPLDVESDWWTTIPALAKRLLQICVAVQSRRWKGTLL